eukprot:scaffold24919_cov101-Isochrysis_galbana.AAC.1
MARPFGVALLLAGWDRNGPTLFHTDPSGTYTKFGAKAIGAGAEGAQTALQEQYHKNLTLQQAETMAVGTPFPKHPGTRTQRSPASKQPCIGHT